MSDPLDQMYVEFLASYDSLDSAPAHASAIFADISAAAEESSTSISDSFDMAGNAANSFAEMSAMAAENAANAMGSVAPATEEIDSAFGDMTVNVINNITNIEEHITQMAAVSEEASTTINNSTESASGGFGSLLGQVGMAAMGFQALSGMATQVAGSLLGPATSAETVKSSLTTMLGSTSAASAELAKLDTFASSTPFETLAIDQAAETLMGFGQKASNVVPEIQSIGDALGSVGRDTPAELDSVVNIFGKITSEGKISAATMNELGIHGINAWKALADGAGKTIPEVKAMVASGLIPAQTAIDDLTKGIEKNPLYAGGMARAAGTFTGLLSTLKSNWDQVIAAFGAPIITALEPEINALGSAFASPAFKAFGGEVGTAIVMAFKDVGVAVKYVDGIIHTLNLTDFTEAWKTVSLEVDYVGVRLERLGSIFSVLGTDADPLAEVIQKIAGAGLSAITALLWDASAAFVNIDKAAQGVNGPLTVVSQSFGKVSSIIGGQLKSDMQWMSDEFQQISGWAQTALLPALASLEPPIMSVADTILTDILPALAQFWADGQQLEQTVLTPLIGLFEEILPPALDVAAVIGTGLAMAFRLIAPLAMGLAIIIGDLINFFTKTEIGGDLLKATLIALSIPVGMLVIGFTALAVEAIAGFIMSIPAMVGGFIAGAAGAWSMAAGVIALTWPILAVIAVIALIILAVQHWGEIAHWIQGVWAGIPGFFHSIASDIGNAFSGLGSFMHGVWDGIAGGVKWAINGVIDIINGFISKIDSIGIDFGGVHIHANIPKIPHLSTGGYVPPGGVAVAGDPSPYEELVFGGTSGATVLSHAQSMAALSGGGGGGVTHVHVYLDSQEISAFSGQNIVQNWLGQGPVKTPRGAAA